MAVNNVFSRTFSWVTKVNQRKTGGHQPRRFQSLISSMPNYASEWQVSLYLPTEGFRLILNIALGLR